MKKILIVDDDENVRRAVRLSLSFHSFSVLDAATGEEGLGLAVAEKPDLILSDVNMSGMDGFALLKRLRAHPETATIPVILMTGVPEQATVRYSMEHGADDYLAKPFNSESLVAAVKARLERQGTLQADAKANEARLLELLSATHDLIAIADPASGTLLFLNSAGRKMLGVTEDANISSLHVAALLCDSAGVHLTERLAQVQQDGLWVGEGEIEARDGRRVPVSEQIMAHARGNAKAAYFSIVARDITERKQAEAKLEKTHNALLETSRLVGMAEVATGVLHNMGNALNSLNVSTTVMIKKIRESRVNAVAKVAGLMEHHAAALGTFITTDPKGQQLPKYLAQLGERLLHEQTELYEELKGLKKTLEHVNAIVSMQQNYAKGSTATEEIDSIELIEDALRMSAGSLARHEMQVVREYASQLPKVTVPKHMVLQVLVNLIRNAQKACDAAGTHPKQLRLRLGTSSDGRFMRMEVADNGVGIPQENLTRIFNHGFTTREDGHGFGLHSGALMARKLGGSLTAKSDGVGKGASFVLEIPCGVAVSAA